MKKYLFYIISFITLALLFSVSYFIGTKVETKSIVTEEDLLETIRLNLDYGRHHYYGWENRKYNGMKVLCDSNDKILFSIDLEKTSPDSVLDDGNNYFTDYRVIYMGIEKKNDYYFRSHFFGDDMTDIDKEKLC